MELKKHFDGQLETIVQDVNHLQCHQEDPQARQPVRVVGLSDEENQQPPSSSSRSGSRSEQMAKIFAEATKGVKDQLKMPPALEQRQQLQQQQEQQEQQLQSRKAAPAPLASHNDWREQKMCFRNESTV